MAICPPPVNVMRGCKQGAPASPYYFLICAEILAIQLRTNKHITGFRIKEFEKLFGQYADDMDIFCEPTQQNIDRIQDALSAFCAISGCKVNYEKTTLYRIGHDNAALAHVYTRGMRVEHNAINVLGVHINRDHDLFIKNNLNELLDKAKVILSDWKNRQLDILLKITVVNTLIMSLFVYRLYVLPYVPNTFIVQLINWSKNSSGTVTDRRCP